MVKTERLVKTFIDLIKIDSLTFEEKEVAQFITSELESLNFIVGVDSAGEKIKGNTGNVIASLLGNVSLPVGRHGSPSLLFCAHMDTVEPGKNIEPIIENGVIKSKDKAILGADDKAGIAVLLEVAHILSEQKISHGDLEFIFTVAEEKGLFGSKNLDTSRFKSKMGYVLDSEGSPGKIVLKAPSQDTIKVVFKGKSAHAGLCPEKGINAIQAASIAVSKMKLGRIDIETTANIGEIRGGLASNIVPEEAIIIGEVRSHSPQKLSTQVKHMKDCVKQACSLTGATAEVEIVRTFDAFSLNKNSCVVRLAVEAAKICGILPEYVVSGGGSDANFFNKSGIATANLSVGAKDVHSTLENISVLDLETSAKWVLEVIRLWTKEVSGQLKT